MHISRPAYKASLPPTAIQAEKWGADLRKHRIQSAIHGAIRDTGHRIARIAVVSQSAIRDFGCLTCENIDQLRSVSHVSQEEKGLVAA